MISFLEPENFPEVFDGIWWATMTAATVGYGDYVPATFLGRILGIILVLVGAGFVAAFFTSFAKKVIQEQNTITKGTVMVKEKNHLVIIGWNERTKKLMLNLEKHENTVVVLIDDSLEKNPFPDKSQIFFYQRFFRFRFRFKTGQYYGSKIRSHYCRPVKKRKRCRYVHDIKHCRH